MATFKKMTLVSEEELDRLKQKQISYNPEVRVLAFLKDEMDQILSRNDLGIEEKLKLFQAAQGRFSTLKMKDHGSSLPELKTQLPEPIVPIQPVQILPPNAAIANLPPVIAQSTTVK